MNKIVDKALNILKGAKNSGEDFSSSLMDKELERINEEKKFLFVKYNKEKLNITENLAKQIIHRANISNYEVFFKEYADANKNNQHFSKNAEVINNYFLPLCVTIKKVYVEKLDNEQIDQYVANFSKFLIKNFKTDNIKESSENYGLFLKHFDVNSFSSEELEKHLNFNKRLSSIIENNNKNEKTKDVNVRRN